MNKIIKLIAIASLSGLFSSNIHYLLSYLNADNLKILGYSSILILGIMGVVLDDSFSQYFGGDSKGIVAVLSSCFSSIFLTNSFRCFTLNESLEGLILGLCLGLFWILLLAIYIKVLIGANQK